MAEVLCIANRHPAEMKSLAFYLIAPQSQIEQGLFKREFSKESKINMILIMLLLMMTELRWEGFGGFINFPLGGHQPVLEINFCQQKNRKEAKNVKG